MTSVTYVQKACSYVTRRTGELLVFEGPEHDGLQIPKGTVETGESPREALVREVREESGLGALSGPTHLTTDVWTRRESPPKRYVRHFFHATVHEPRDRWTHTVRDGGEEHGAEFDLYWVRPRTDREFALELDEYVHMLPGVNSTEHRDADGTGSPDDVAASD